MTINTDLNILGGLPDWNLLNVFLKYNMNTLRENGGVQNYTAIKTDKSVKRFEKAISATLIRFCNVDVEMLVRNMLTSENMSNDSLLLIFWNASYNNELLHYLNTHMYFPAFYSGRMIIRTDEASACLKDLREREEDLRKWTDLTLNTTASKYLTLLKKFNLLVGSAKKEIAHPYLSDKMFVHFIYWLAAVEEKANILESTWLTYSMHELAIFKERVVQKRYAEYYHFTYTGDKLKIETIIPYNELYARFSQS